MKHLLVFCLLLGTSTYGTTPIWSKLGHRVVGEVASEHLNRRAQKAISELLDGQSLAAVSNYADEIKADRTYRDFSPWHYVNFPADQKYTDGTPDPAGDVVSGIQKCIAILENPASKQEDKVFYLKMLIHLIGDLHQPMHIGREEDRGGNDIQLQWFGRGSNLHKIWDADMINDYGMSYTELAQSLPRRTKKEVRSIQQGGVYEWVEESQEVANMVYASAEKGEKLSYAYSYAYWQTVEAQLQKGGLRLAKVLNEIFT